MRILARESMIQRKLRKREGRRASGLALLALTIALAQSGCAMSVALPSFFGDDSTASIKPAPASPTLADVDAQDWPLAEPALAKALRAEASANWSNPATGKSGAFLGVAASFNRAGQICRAFIARIELSAAAPAPAQAMQGIGCLAQGERVVLSDLTPYKGF